MNITLSWLKREKACVDGVDYYNTLNETDALKIMACLLADKKLNYANWTITHLLNRENRVRYAIFAARQVLHFWKNKYPKEAAIWEEWADNPTAAAAAYAAHAAYAAAAYADDDAAYADDDDAAKAAYAAYAAAACADDDAAYAAHAAYAAAAYADYAAIKLKIIRNGIELFKKQEE